VGEVPLVVVPGHHLDHCAVDHSGQLQVGNGGAWVTDDVGGHQRVLGDAEHVPLQVVRKTNQLMK
jgi:hypothetical protein